MKRIAALIAPIHRVLLVLSSVTVGVVGSRVASDPSAWQPWTLLVASGLLLFVSDLARHIDERARTIAVTTKSPIAAARRDVASLGEARVVTLGLALAVALAAVVALAEMV